MAGRIPFVRGRPWVSSRGISSFRQSVQLGPRLSFSHKDVLFMDNHVLCVNKPAGLLSQGDRTKDADVAALAREYVRVAANKPGEAFVALVHRLDRPVSGAMCIARTSKAAARLSASFRVREGVEKIYHAVVAGTLSGSGTREDFLVSLEGGGGVARDGRGPRTAIFPPGGVDNGYSAEEMPPTASLSPAVAAGTCYVPPAPRRGRPSLEGGARRGGVREAGDYGPPRPSPPPLQAAQDRADGGSASARARAVGAKRAVIEWEAVEMSPSTAALLRCPRTGDARTLIRVRLVTGRKHQIRVQLAEMGHPVIGDVRYGRSCRGKGGHDSGPSGSMEPLEDRSIMLHASELAVPHPTRVGCVVRVVAPLPVAWGALCGKEVLKEVFGKNLPTSTCARPAVFRASSPPFSI